jgi:beta-lactamase class C
MIVLRKRLFALILLAWTPMFSGLSEDAQAARRRPAPVPPAPPTVDVRSIATDAVPIAAEFGRWIDRIEKSGHVAGLAVAIVKDDRVLLERGIGYSDWSKREKIEPDTVFRLASLSKAFATTLTGLLVEDGVMAWDTRISNVLPTFALADIDASRKLTIGDILSHRVGLPHNTYDNLLEQDEPYPLLVDRLSQVPLACPVGDCYAYQNVAFSLIGDVTYAMTGDFFYHEVEKRIFHPLNMHSATYGRESLEHSARWARPHRRSGRQWKPFMPNETYYRMPPAAGVNASLRDMEQWLIAQMGGRPEVLSPALLQALQTPRVETPHDLRSTPWRRSRLLDARYALGWRVYEYAGETLVFHAGAVQGYRAMIGFLPQRRFGLVMLWNCESAAPGGLLPMLFDRYLGLPSIDWAGVGPTRIPTSHGGDLE